MNNTYLKSFYQIVAIKYTRILKYFRETIHVYITVLILNQKQDIGRDLSRSKLSVANSAGYCRFRRPRALMVTSAAYR